MRDSQRQKVYRAESQYDHEAKTTRVSFEFAQDTVACLADSFKVRTPEVTYNPRLQRVAGQYTAFKNLIEFSTERPRMSVVVHEFAHHLSRERIKGKKLYGLRPHGGGFTEAMLDATEDIMGTGNRKVLNSAYIDKNVLVGLRHEIDHVANNGKKWFDAPRHRDEEEGKVFLVQRTLDSGMTVYHAGVDSYGDHYTSAKHYAKGFRYPGSALKAGKRLFGEKYFQVLEVDGYYDAHKKHWVPN